MTITDEVKTFCQEIGLDLIRVTSAEYLSSAARRIEQQVQRGLWPEFKINKISFYCNPRSFLPSAKSVIVAAESCLTSEPIPTSKPNRPLGKIARYTWRNYYYDVKSKLRIVAEFLRERTTEKLRFRCYSNGPLAEKPLACQAGVGWYGKHGIIMNRNYGSWIVLGELLINVSLDEDEPVEDDCGSCQACIKACPTRAIIEPHVLEQPKCLQYMNYQNLVMPIHARECWGDRLYGCTACQDACPVNSKVQPTKKRIEYGYVGPSLELLPILQMSEEEYRQHFKKNQMGESWVSFAAIQRNAAVALGNIGDSAAIPMLARTLKNNRSAIVRMHTAWALGKIGDQDAVVSLKEALKLERRKEVRQEIKSALDKQ